LEELRRRLIEGQWPPQTVLQEQELADDLRLSKTPVREALQMLAARRLVRPVPRLGYVVADIALDDVAEVFEFRTLIETELAARLAARGILMEEPLTEATEPSWQGEWRFHRLLAEAAGPRVRRTLEELLDESCRAVHYLRLPAATLAALGDDHQAIAHAITARDTVLAQALMTIHLTRMRESLMATLRQKLRDQNLLA
jgi:DNA-binding GntR family transcriptional regulator